MKFFVSVFLLFISSIVTGQTNENQLVVRSFVKEDTVLLRWAPLSAEIMINGLKNGYKIERIDGVGSFENNTSLQTFFVKPFNETKLDFQNSLDKNVSDLVNIVNELATSSTLSPTAKSMSYAVLMMAAGTNKEIAKMLGIYFEDIGTKKTNYTYRISVQNKVESSGEFSINAAVISKNLSFTVLNGSARTKLKQAYLSWEAKSLQEGYSAYWIERSTDSINFEKRNNLPYLFLKSSDEPNKINCDFVDTGVTEGITYFYRITGITHFAEIGKSSNIVKVYVPISLYGECRIDSVVAIGLNRTLTGHFVPRNSSVIPQNKIAENKVFEGRFLLYRSDSLRDGYQLLSQQINTTNTFDFTANVPLESGDRYYYKVAALSVDNDTVYSFPYYFFTLDQIPPQTPVGLAGIVNDSGVVALTWNLNNEKDIRGYRVYRSNSLKEEFTEVTKFFCEDNVFYDTLSLNNLSSKIYYRISAVDFNYNNSKKTEPVLLLKPDTIPPVPIIFTDYSVVPEGVSLKWVNASSEDVLENRLFRKNDGKIIQVFLWRDSAGCYVDTVCVVGKHYGFFVATFDKSQNKVISAELGINFETGVRPSVSNITQAVNLAEKTILLSWILPSEEIYSIQIYRAKNDEPFRLISTLRKEEFESYTDSDLSMNNIYKYKIKVIYKSGVSSTLSEEIKVIY